MKYTFENRTCRNCEAEMPEQSLYCPKCSQKNTDGRIPIFDFVKDALESIFNIDSKFFKTSLGLLIPGMLTNEFFKGKHRSFATPSRLFIASALLFFAMLGLLVQNELKDEKMDGDVFGMNSNKGNQEILADVEKIRKEFPESISPQMEAKLDSMEAQALRDTLDNRFAQINLWKKRGIQFERADFENITLDSMIQKYEIDNFADKIIFSKAYKFAKNPRSLLSTLIGNLTWMMLLLIPSLALVFKLLYIRRSKFYVEHLVFLFHTHAFVLLVGAVALASQYFEIISLPGEAIPWTILGFSIYTLIAMKMVYKQGLFKTLAKSFVIFISYFILLGICIGIIGIVSFLLF